MRNGISISLLYFTEGNVFVMILLYHSLWLKGNNMNKENLEYLSNPNRCRADDLRKVQSILQFAIQHFLVHHVLD